MLFGCHVSIAGGIENAPKRAADLGAEVFQIFSRSPRGGKAKPITPEIAQAFKDACEEHNQKEWVIHAPYYVNFASANPRIYHGSVSVVRDELERGSLIDATYMMIHTGSFKDLGKEKGMPKVIDGLAKVLDGYKGSTQFCIEITAGAGHVIGAKFEEVAEIINHKKLKKYDIGVCFDTQHAFGSGYDLRTAKDVKATLDEFDATIGLDKLKLFHLNDSKVELGSNRDRHEHIGDGHIGKAGFEALAKEKRVQHLNFYLETEHDKVEKDISLMKSLRDNA